MYVCLCVRTCIYIYSSVYVCVYMCIYGEKDRYSIVKEKPFVTHPCGHIFHTTVSSLAVF